MKRKKVFIAMSGGVDSSVAAILLKQSGYSVYGVHMQNWDPEVNGENIIRSTKGCSNKDDLKMAQAVANHLNIPLKIYNFVPEYWEQVFLPFLDSIKNNTISNPDIFCNKKIKFGALLDLLISEEGEDILLATGHYAKIINKDDKFLLGTCSNAKKDQTYFLSQLTQKQLSHILFPLSEFNTKEEIRKIAKQNNLPNWNKIDSRGICFIGKRNFKSFILNYLELIPGKIIDISNNKIVGKHKGINLYALHQHCKLGGNPEKYYVCKKDKDNNQIYVCKKSEIIKYLYSTSSTIKDIHWINEIPKEGDKLYIKSKHTPLFIDVVVTSINSKQIVLKHNNIFMTTPGQFIVFYNINKDLCLGSGIYSIC